MPPAKKRKTAAKKAVAIEEPAPEDVTAQETTAEPATDSTAEPTADLAPKVPAEATTSEETVEGETAGDAQQKAPALPSEATEPAPAASSAADASSAAAAEPAAEPAAATTPVDRMARFRALQARAKTSSDQNLKAAAAEAQRQATDPSQLTALHRRHAIVSHKILKADVEEAGEDFERKRAWDWTIEESERWDKRMKKKDAARDNNAFQDYRQDSQKVYKRQVKNMAASQDLEKYTREKLAAIEKAAAAGTLDIVETEDGELIAVDKNGTFYSSANSTSFANSKPDKAAVDRLIADLNKADEVAAKKRKAREAKNGDDADVTYINDKNKQFNQKLSRFYNKYTAEIRDSFERGTMI